LTPTYTNNVNVGTAIASASYPGDASHEGSSNSATFDIGKAALTIKADAKSKTYGDDNPALTATVTGTLNGDTLNYTLATTALKSSGVGDYPITVTLGSNPNYAVTTTDGTLSITPASATVTLNNLIQISDGTPKPVTVTTNPLGLSVSVTYNGSSTPPINPGNYAVVATITDPNYTGTASGRFVIQANNTHSISLVQGWNLVSFNVHPANPDPATVLSSIADKYDLVYAWDATGAHSASGNWLIYDTRMPSFLNTLQSLDEKMGFWVHMTAPGTLEVTGTATVTTNISLSVNAGGWNLVGFPSSVNRLLPAALTENGCTNFSLMYAYGANEWKLFDLNMPDFLNSLTELSPGWAYWVKVTSNCTWSVSP
jgi:hypothetical protein